MTRSTFLMLPLAAVLRAGPSEEVWDMLTSLAAALSEGNADAFLGDFDRAMPGYQQLRANVTALLSVAEVQSSIELVDDRGSDSSRNVELDWFLRITPRREAVLSTRRQQRVKCRVEKSGKKWRIASLEPLEFFDPPRV